MHSMAKIVTELGQQRQMRRTAPVEVSAQFGEWMDEAVQAVKEKRANLTRFVTDKCFAIMRHHSPLKIPREKRRNFLILLVQQVDNHHLEDLFFVADSRKKLKLDYLEVIRGLPCQTDAEIRLIMDAGLLALCKDTALGRVFHIKRKGTTPSIKHGLLEVLALYLNHIATGREVDNLHPHTQAALKAECNRSKSFAASLKQTYPQLYRWVEPAIAAPEPDKKEEQAFGMLRTI